MGFDQTSVQAFSVALVVEDQQAHENQNRYDTPGYNVLHHGATPGVTVTGCSGSILRGGGRSETQNPPRECFTGGEPARR
jgi:hypothetical protein